MKRKWFALLVALIVILSFIFVIKGQVKDSKIVLSTEVLGFPLKLVSEKKISSTPYTWEGKLLIPVVSYSKENLDKIILWYSNRHPKGDGKIILTIFTDENALGIEDRFVGTPSDPTDKVAAPAPYNAIFFRDDKGDDGFYVYDLNLGKKDKKGVVTLSSLQGPK